jgi:endoglucanase Acf2
LIAGGLWAQAAVAAEVVAVGPGGYRTTKPGPCKPLPAKIYKTENCKAGVPTNQWFSSLLYQQYSQPLYAHPIAVTCQKEGLNVTYPGANVRGTEKTIFATVQAKEADITVGHSAADSFPEALCDGYSDWFVTVAMGSAGKSMRASFGHGSPFVYCLYEGGQAKLTFKNPPRVWAGSPQTPVLGVTVNNRHYGLFAPAGSTWAGAGTSTLVCQSHKPYFSLALLPDAEPATLAGFAKVAHNHVTDTRLEYAIDAGVVRATYQFTLKSYEGVGQVANLPGQPARRAAAGSQPAPQGTLFALYPHQWKYATTKLTGKTYASVRGTMKIGAGESFTTEVPIQGVLPLLPPQGVQDRARMTGYLQEEARMKLGEAADTYWEGKLLGRLATLSGVAEATGARDMQAAFVREIEHRLEGWFTAAPNKDKGVFYYDANWKTLVGSPPSYGSDWPLNDHHFHYGYFIRAAAEVARVDPAWAKKWSPMVQLLIREIASPDRNDPMFPYLRCFDRYAGHSWASGDANFVDGNNQESSSESLNAWYGMILWGQATGDEKIRDLGLALFNIERTAVEQYWFDVDGTNYPKGFPQVALGMVWGGKGDFATWFSGDIDCIHGINWLPFTPASIYMGRFPEYVKKNHTRIVEKRKGGGDYNTGWGDLVCMFSALYDADAAARYIDAVPNCKLEGGNSHAFMYHWIYTLKNLGRNDAAVTADYPIVNVYNRNGTKTYAVYNYTPKPLTVKFSDGKTVQCKGAGLTVTK